MAVVRGGATEHERALAYQWVRLLVGTSMRVPQVAELAIARLVRDVFVLTKEGFEAAGAWTRWCARRRAGVPFTRHRLDLT